VPAGQRPTIHRIGQQGTATGDVTEPKAALKEYGFGAPVDVPAISAPEHHLARVGCQAYLIEDVDQLDTGPRGGARSAKTPPLAWHLRGQASGCFRRTPASRPACAIASHATPRGCTSGRAARGHPW
jgi:hypothetical protein